MPRPSGVSRAARPVCGGTIDHVRDRNGRDEPGDHLRGYTFRTGVGVILAVVGMTGAGMPALVQAETSVSQAGAIDVVHYARQQYARPSGGFTDPMDDGPIMYDSSTGGTVIPPHVGTVSPHALSPAGGTVRISLTGGARTVSTLMPVSTASATPAMQFTGQVAPVTCTGYPWPGWHDLLF
jgi:hypothetical protein